jgi:hypothetical protein
MSEKKSPIVIVQELTRGNIFIAERDTWAAIGSLLSNHSETCSRCHLTPQTYATMLKVYCGSKIVEYDPKTDVITFAKTIQNPTILMQYTLWMTIHQEKKGDGSSPKLRCPTESA